MLQSKTPKRVKPAEKICSGTKKAKIRKTRLPPAGTKQQEVLGLLRQPKGATVTAMMEATGWQQHSVRGFLAGVVRKALKLKLTSEKSNGVRIYRIGGGKGLRSLPAEVARQ
jgi:hypothetical protein